MFFRNSSGSNLVSRQPFDFQIVHLTTAEGVETVEQFDWLRAEGCNEVQGFLFSAAKPSADIKQLLLDFADHASRAA